MPHTRCLCLPNVYNTLDAAVIRQTKKKARYLNRAFSLIPISDQFLLSAAGVAALSVALAGAFFVASALAGALWVAAGLAGAFLAGSFLAGSFFAGAFFTGSAGLAGSTTGAGGGVTGAGAGAGTGAGAGAGSGALSAGFGSGLEPPNMFEKKPPMPPLLSLAGSAAFGGATFTGSNDLPAARS